MYIHSSPNSTLMKRLYLLLLSISCSIPGVCQEIEPGYFMQPDIHDNLVVFVAEGDIWKVPVSGGEAIRLTTHEGDEMSPKISPDGNWIAYAASYEGPTEVYILPLQGGQPRRLTFEAVASIPTAWKSATEIAYVTNQYSTLPHLNTVIVDINSLQKAILPLEMAAEGSFSSDGNIFFFVRPTYHNNVTKRYEGGTARQIWKYTSGEAEAVKLTRDYKGEDHHPIYHNERVYFLSARNGIMNVWSMDLSGGDLLQHTHQESYDVREVALSGDRLVYRTGADIRMMNLSENSDEKISITLTSDFNQMREKWVNNPQDYITKMALSNDGKKVAVTARGRVFIFPVDKGRMVRISRKEGIRYRDATFATDENMIMLFSDESGEFELHQFDPLGMTPGRQLSTDGSTLRFEPVPSPDGRWVAYTDLNQEAWVMDIQSGKSSKISRSQEGVSSTMSWSPDSKWLAFVEGATNTFNQILLYNVESKKHVPLTSDRANSLNPQWSKDGKWIYFLSDRNFQTVIGAPWGPRQPEPFWEKQMKIYHISLQKDLVSPFHYDQETAEDNGDSTDTGSQVVVEEEGIMERLREVPVPAGNYKNLVVTDKALYYHSTGPGLQVYSTTGPASRDDKAPVMMTTFDPEAEQKVFLENVQSFIASQNNEYILVNSNRKYYAVPLRLSPVKDLSDYDVDMSDWTFPINIREDWEQLFKDAWRMERDYFYDPGMHGVDWDQMYEKYLPLAKRVTTRTELNDVMGELIGELSILHTSVRGGDLPEGKDQIDFGMLGARLIKGEKGYVIDRIYLSDPDYPDEMSPLANPDVQIKEGSVITHVDGISVMDVPDIYYLLRDKDGKQVRLSVISSKTGVTTDRLVVPLTMWQEMNLRYNEWEYTRRLRVDELSAGKFGYVHLRAMGSGDIAQWYRDFYPQFQKEGLVIDMRHNRGGNIDSFILEKLMRQAFFYWKGRTGEATWNMQYAFRGHLVLLVDEFTASDGEAFAEGFRRLGLGKSIGTRTWGGEVWLSGGNRLTDNGLARAPMTGVYGEEGEWLIEGVGFIPDIEIVNMPKATFEGEDAQLEAAVKHLQELVKEDPRPVPEVPEYPDKSFKNGGK
jgi:tricorn protease